MEVAHAGGTSLKSTLIDNFYKKEFGNEVICEYVGIAKDELSRVQIKRSKNIKIYPLILWGMTENDCLTKCYKNGFTYQEANGVQLYQILDRVSCYCCANKNLKELKAIYKFLPEYWQKIKDLQAKTTRQMRDDYTLEELEERFKKE